MIKFRNFGRKSLNEISEILQRHGMHFGMKLHKNDKGEWELLEDLENFPLDDEDSKYTRTPPSMTVASGIRERVK